jgi:chaperonin GroES
MKKASEGKAKKLSVKPLGDRVLVKPVSADDEKLPSGLYIPDTARKEKPERGEVVAVGPGKRGDDNELIPVSVKVGDMVMFSKYGFDEVKIEDEEYYIVSESSILAILN